MKGQSSMEFLAYISLSMFILASLYTVMASKQQETFRQQTQEAAEIVSEKAAFEVEMALVQGEGYSRVFSLPETVGGHNYTVNITRGNVLVDWDDRTILRSTRYEGESIVIESENSNIFRVIHNRSGVFVNAQ